MELKLLQADGKLGAGVSASPEVFEREYNEALIHQIVVAYQANARSGNRAQKDREQVKHTTKKPWRQKAQAALVLVCHLHHCGAGVVAYSLTHQMKTSHKKLTERCIAQVCVQSCLSWLAKVA